MEITQQFANTAQIRRVRKLLEYQHLKNPAKRCIFVVDTKGDNLMLTKVQKWGNSLALRIPKAFAVDAQLANDSLVEVSVVEGQIIITPIPAPRWTLDALLAGITKNNLHNEVDTGFAVGNEVW